MSNQVFPSAAWLVPNYINSVFSGYIRHGSRTWLAWSEYHHTKTLYLEIPFICLAWYSINLDLLVYISQTSTVASLPKMRLLVSLWILPSVTGRGGVPLISLQSTFVQRHWPTQLSSTDTAAWKFCSGLYILLMSIAYNHTYSMLITIPILSL